MRNELDFKGKNPKINLRKIPKPIRGQNVFIQRMKPNVSAVLKMVLVEESSNLTDRDNFPRRHRT